MDIKIILWQEMIVFIYRNNFFSSNYIIISASLSTSSSRNYDGGRSILAYYRWLWPGRREFDNKGNRLLALNESLPDRPIFLRGES